MKKYIVTIIVELLLLLNLSFYLYLDYMYIKSWIIGGYYFNTISLIVIIATITCLIAIILIAIKDFPVFKPLVDKLTANKEQRAQAKAKRAEETKQAKIKALEAELEELKKDE